MRLRRLLGGIALGIALSLPARAAPPATEAEAGPAPWVERMLAALRLGDTLAARIRANTVDYTGSERDVVIELLRDARGPTMRSVVEVREADPESETQPVVFRIDSFADGSLVSWLWDIRWQRFVKMSGLEGTENFDGTHFHLEDLGFSGLGARRRGSVRELNEPPGAVEIISGAYHHYSRVETRIDRATGLPLRTFVYDGTGARIWETSFEDVETVAGHPLPTRMRTENPVTRELSTLEWSHVAVGLRIPDEAFDLEYLDAVIRRGGDPIEMSVPAATAAVRPGR
jgi:Outer membrane lipoprotein-sorting protein